MSPPPAPPPDLRPLTSDLRPFARLLASADLIDTTRSPLPDGRTLERSLYDTDEAYPLIVFERVLSKGPDGEVIDHEKAMVGDHIIVTSNLPEEEFAALNRRHGAEVRRQIPNQNTWLVSFPDPTPDTVAAAVVEYARALGPDGLASPDHVVYPAATPNDPYFGNLWGLNQAADHDIDAPEAWNYHTGDSSVVVMVIDTGIDYAHPDLAANMWRNPGEIPGNSVDDDGNGYVDDIYGYDFYNWDNNPTDDHGHGTHCAGTIGGVGNNGVGVAGVCWNVRLIAGKFIGASGYGYDSGAMAAVYYGTAKGNHLSSNSWGGGGFNSSLKASIDAANAAGILFVAAAGNSGTDNDASPFYPCGYDSANIIAVTATTTTGANVYNYGATTVDIGAPGTSIYSTYPGSSYAYMSGTSMATPHVAGACALLKAARPDYTGAQLRTAILGSAEPIASLAGRCVTGGRLNVRLAMEQAGIPTYPLSLSGSAAGPNQVNLSWTDTAANETGFEIQRKTGPATAEVQDNSTLGNHATLMNAPIWTADASGGHYSLATTQYLRINDADSLSVTSGGFTVSAWVKPSSAVEYRIASKAATSSAAEWIFTLTPSGNLALILYDTTTSPMIAATSTLSFNSDVGSWVHYSATYDGTGINGIRLYRNGVQISTTSSSRTGFVSMKNTSSALAIGAFIFDSATPSYGVGSTDAFRLYARALSGTEISTLHSSGRSASRDAVSNSSLRAFLDMDDPAQSWSTVATTTANATTFSDTTVFPDTDYNYRVRATSTSGGSAWTNIASTRTPASGIPVPNAPSTLAVANSTENQVDLTWVDNANNETSQTLERLAGFPDPAPTYQVPDRSAQLNHGYLVGSPLWTTDSPGGHYTSAAAGRYLRINDADSLSFTSGGFTVSSWVKPSAAAEFRIASKASTSSSAEWIFTLTASGSLALFLYDTTTAPMIGATSSLSFSGDVGSWVHYAATYDGTGIGGIRLYRNGVLLTTTSSSRTGFVSMKNTTAALSIGAFLIDSTPSYGLGSTDAFRLYARALAGAEVTTLYSTGRFAGRDAVSNSGLRVFLDMDVPTPAWSALATLDENVSTYSDTTTAPDTDYHYRVRASNNSGPSSWSSIASIRTPASGIPAPFAPSALAITGSTVSHVDLSWVDNANNETALSIERLEGFPDSEPNYQVPDRSSYLNHAVLIGSPTWIGDAPGGHYSLAATGRYLRINDNDSLSVTSGGFTISAWVKPSSAAEYRIASKAATSSAAEWIFTLTPSGNLALLLYDATTTPMIGATSTQSFSGDVGSWVHLAATYDGTGINGIRLYRNGVLLTTSSSSRTGFVSMKNTSSALTVGAFIFDSATPSYGLGSTDAFRLYARALSDAEIIVLYSTGRSATRDAVSNSGLRLFLDMNVPAPSWSALATVAENTSTYSDVTVTPDTDYHYRVRSSNATGPSAWSNIASTRTPASGISTPAAPAALVVTGSTANRIDLSWSDNTDNETAQALERLAGFPDAAPTYQVADRSIQLNHAYLVGSPSWTTDAPGGHYTLAATGRYLRINDTDSLSVTSGGFSVSSWVKPSSVSEFRIASKTASSSAAEWIFTLTPSGNLALLLYDTTTTPMIGATSTQSFSGDIGTWVHYAATYDGTGISGLRLYRNGVLLTTTSSSRTGFVSMKNTSSALAIGAFIFDSATPSYGLGSTDAFRMYARTLSGAEVISLYSAGRFATRDAISSTSLVAFLDMNFPAPAWSPLAVVLANVTSYSDTTVQADTDYHYRVLASNASGSSAWSNVASTRTSVSGLGELGAGSGGLGAEVGGQRSEVGNTNTDTGIRLTLSWAEPVAPAAGTHSLTSDLRPLTSAPATGVSPLLTWTSRDGATYAIEFTPSLDMGFGLLVDGLPATPPVNTFQLPADTPEGFFRIVER